jgi:hypothetical protein
MTVATGSWLPLLIVVSAPKRRALSSRLSARSIAMILPGVYSLAVRIAFENVQVGAADRRGVDPHDRVGWVEDRGIGHAVPAALPGAVVNERLHLGTFW